MPRRLVLGNGKATYSTRQAQGALAGFAFGTTPVETQRKTRPGVHPASWVADLKLSRYRWGYRTFDCVPTSPNGFSFQDLAVAVALDSQLGGMDLLQAAAIAPVLAEVISAIPITQTFWTLPYADLGTATPSQASPAYPLWSAYQLLSGLKGIKETKATKALHHKRPWYFPLVDSYTSQPLGGKLAWQTIHHDLEKFETEFVELEEWFAGVALQMHGVALTRLRIHDILLWGECEGSRAKMIGLGALVRRENGF
jgi:hypothetical protein